VLDSFALNEHARLKGLCYFNMGPLRRLLFQYWAVETSVVSVLFQDGAVETFVVSVWGR
jgi:hypothetical protein